MKLVVLTLFDQRERTQLVHFLLELFNLLQELFGLAPVLLQVTCRWLKQIAEIQHRVATVSSFAVLNRAPQSFSAPPKSIKAFE